jgi:hypothetical protein
MKNAKILGYIAYAGPSMIDGRPIVVIVNRIDSRSNNEKTGALVQSFIVRSDVDPVAALATGDDVSICGMCPHRPILAKRTGDAPCYVNVGRSVRSVYNAFRRGRYVAAPVAEISIAIKGKRLRIGTYGDPAAAPVDVWLELTRNTSAHVGYSHQWQRPEFDASAWAPLVMASADNDDEAKQARELGLRYFRVSIGVEKRPGEVTCPASAEGGRKTTCADCLLCGGTSKAARNIVIADHAAGAQSRARRAWNIAIAA